MRCGCLLVGGVRACVGLSVSRSLLRLVVSHKPPLLFLVGPFGRYAAVLSTFLVQAFSFDSDPDADKSFGTILTNVFVGAIMANVLLFPVQ